MNKKEILNKAYAYLFPLVLMDATKDEATNAESPGKRRAPINQFCHYRTLATSEDRATVKPNVDTLYSVAWLDLSYGPVYLEVPDVDRYMIVQVMDAWTDAAIAIDKGGKYVFVRDNMQFDCPADTQRVNIDTNIVWIITRTMTYGKDDLEATYAIQDQLKLTSAYSKGEYDASKDYVPMEHVLSMNPVDFFNKGNKLLMDNPPRPEDAEFTADFDKFGIGAGLQFDSQAYGDSLEEDIKDIIAEYNVTDISKVSEYIKQMGCWSFWDDPIGRFGTAFYYRAYVAFFGAGANPTYVAIYPMAMYDSDGDILNGQNSYVLHYSTLPTVKGKGFWSVTAYGEDQFLIDNPIDRYAVTDRFDFELNDDGSLDIIISATQPSDGKVWLPVSKGVFSLAMRLYSPDMDVFKNWKVPTITKIK